MATNTFTRYVQKNVGTSAVTMLTAANTTQTTVIGMTAANTTSSPITVSAYLNNSFSATGATSGSSTTLTITALASGLITNNQVITGTGISGTVTIVTQLTATGTAVATIAYSSGGASGANTVTLANVTGVLVGQLVSGTNLPAGTFVLSVNTTTNTITTSNAFTGTASGNYVFYTPGGIGTYTMSSAQTISSTTISSNTNFYVVNAATVPVGGSLALFGGDGKLVLNTNDAFVVVSSAATSADFILSCLQIS
jgi:hypothetical protein